jgi:site-specific recombinase XerD
MQELPEYLNPEDVEKLIKAASTNKNKLIIKTLYVLGLRVSELTGIQLPHIDHKRRTVIVYGKGNRSRILPVPEQLYRNWTDHIEKSKPHCFLFEDAFGKDYYTRRIREIVNMTARIASIEHTSPHKLRHSRATQLLNDNLPLPMLQRFLGHAHLNTTAIYTHLAVEPMRKFM